MYEHLRIREPSKWLRAVGPACALCLTAWIARGPQAAVEPPSHRTMQASLVHNSELPLQRPLKRVRSLHARKGKAGVRHEIVRSALPDSPAEMFLSGEGDSDESGGGGDEDEGAIGRVEPPPPPTAPPRKEPRARPFSWSWSCDYPFTVVNDSTVLVRVHVDDRGRAESVDIVNYEHHEFVAEAKHCAMQKSYVAPKDATGKPVAAATDVLPIHFRRYGTE